MQQISTERFIGGGFGGSERLLLGEHKSEVNTYMCVYICVYKGMCIQGYICMVGDDVAAGSEWLTVDGSGPGS